MSDTPRTDAEAGYDDASGCWKYREDGPYVDADFARQLERENAALREKMKVSWDEISVLVNQNSALLEALKTIAKYDQNSPHGDGICPYGCDCPSIANTALIKARKEAQP
jgi:hypothetical protein